MMMMMMKTMMMMTMTMMTTMMMMTMMMMMMMMMMLLLMMMMLIMMVLMIMMMMMMPPPVVRIRIHRPAPTHHPGCPPTPPSHRGQSRSTQTVNRDVGVAVLLVLVVRRILATLWLTLILYKAATNASPTKDKVVHSHQRADKTDTDRNGVACVRDSPST
jgi:hypothetical protein